MIELRKITKTVRSGIEDLTILDDVSISIPDGQFVAVTGASGSGKSTLLGLIAGLDAPSAGQIFIDDDEITALKEDSLAEIRSKKIGFVFQSFHLIPSLTAFENILIPMEILGLSNARERAEMLIQNVDLANRGHHYPAELSGGEQQRVAIARALANRPLLLLADEPTGNLDPTTAAQVHQELLRLIAEEGLGALVATHNHELAAGMSRIARLEQGRIIGG